MDVSSEGEVISEPQEVALFVQSIQRTLNCLSDPERSTRKRALETLQRRLMRGDNAPASPDILQAAWDQRILQTVLKSLQDRVEKCRELAVSLIDGVVKIIPKVDQTALLLLPVIADRLGQTPVPENSEEIRLQLLTLLSDSLLKRCSDATLMAVVNPLCNVIVSSLTDLFHGLKKAACQIIVLVFGRAKDRLKDNVEQVLRVLLLNINHTHSRVRMAVLQAMDAVIGCGLPAGVIAEDLAPMVRVLAFDHSQSVRELFFICVARWQGYKTEEHDVQGNACYLSNGKDTTIYIPRLLPLLLLGITDESSDIANTSLTLVEGVGNVYLQLKDIRTASHLNEADPDTSMMEFAQMDQDTRLVKSSPSGEFSYPSPYKGRPSKGCRSMVQGFLGELLEPVVKDLRDWTVQIRLGAARVLHTLLIFAEDRASEKLNVLLPALCVAVGEDDLAVVQRVIQAVHVLGYHVSPDLWLDFILDNLTSFASTDAQKANALVVLAGLLYKTQKQYLNENCVVQLCRGLSQPEVCLSEHPAVRQQLLAALTNLVRVGGPLCQSSSFEICVLLLRLQSVEGDVQLQNNAKKLLETAANEVVGCSIDKFYEKHLRALIDTVIVGHEEWLGDSPGRFVFQALLHNTAPYVGPYIEELLPLFIKCLQPDRDPALRISFLQLLDELFEKPQLGPWWSPLAVDVIGKMLVPCGIWHVGKVGAAIRHRAMVALGTFLRQGLCSQMHLLQVLQSGQLIPVATSCLEEDFYVDTRHVTSHVFDNVLQIAGNVLNDEQRVSLSYVLQKRLDDSSDIVRLGVLRTIHTFFYTMPECSNNQQVENFLRNVLVHMDDSNAEIQEAVCQAVEACAYKKPDVVISLLESVGGHHQTQKFCDHLLNIASAIQNQRSLQTFSHEIH
ncbi:hypothetical protein O6H91_05G024700 [Diphasiastrum complanatum]|uniref:Uncharacterized protein n=4 Tax=Diphasiastrum complanatum TaxID=34168 RepID=A0ACC2DMC9_DIPCM|nr:hypothetical protein O6H91_05G024700 [Diphasiastrum complanatum]KAJ7555167.1 hypothetical protein O6H91_05G024700 [Diphasiastrum complanatum]KAJ7555168.1 hypothetical protein O6H91_05G024700 [Diphasiastrum complanatum]KAJ7555169.1 hypothetical protein O6H91_05G024700 [Diphasiastrum complanatum]